MEEEKEHLRTDQSLREERSRDMEWCWWKDVSDGRDVGMVLVPTMVTIQQMILNRTHTINCFLILPRPVIVSFPPKQIKDMIRWSMVDPMHHAAEAGHLNTLKYRAFYILHLNIITTPFLLLTFQYNFLSFCSLLEFARFLLHDFVFILYWLQNFLSLSLSPPPSLCVSYHLLSDIPPLFSTNSL